jgi:hypothetical protein
MDGTIYDNGNVGIGSVNPRSKLDIDGVVYATTYYGSGANLTNLPASMTYPSGTGVAVVTSGTSWGTTLGTDGSGDCASGTVCLGDHTHSSYLTAVASDSTWTVHGSYPAACSAGQYVSAIGDTLTCGTPTDTNTTYTATANRGLLLTSSTQFGLIETCNSGELLKWNGSAWACATDTTGASSGTPGGSSTQIQYNNAGALGGVDGFIYNGTALSYTGNIGIGVTSPSAKLSVDGAIYAGSGTPSPTWGGVSMASAGDAYFKGDIEVDGMVYVDNSIYLSGNIGIGTALPAARLDIAGASGYLSPKGVTSDPCGTQPEGTMFYNSTNHRWCFCDNSGVDLTIYGGAACF